MTRREKLSGRHCAALVALYESGAYDGRTSTVYALTEECRTQKRGQSDVSHPLPGIGSGYGATFASLKKRGYVDSRLMGEAGVDYWWLTDKGLQTARLLLAQAGGPKLRNVPRLRPSSLAALERLAA